MTDLVNLGFKADSRGIIAAQRDMNNLTAAGDRLDKQNKLTERSLGLVGAAIAALGVSASTRELIQYADTWTNVNSQLRQVTSSEGELSKVRSQLLGVTRDTRMELSNTVNLYAEMTRGTSELNISSDRLVGVTKTLNNLFLAGGKPISESAGAIRQLNQGFAAGALRGDEFNSVAEGAPKVLDALQASLGMSRSELRAFAATGGITAQIMVDALEAYRDTAQKLADQTEKTFEQNLQNAQTNVTEFVGNSKALNDVVKTLGSGIEDLSENIDALTNAGLGLAAVYGGSMVLAAGKSAAATYADIAAKAELLKMERANSASVAELVAMKSQEALASARVAAAVQAESVTRLKASMQAFEAEMALENVRMKNQISETGRIQSGVRMSEINVARTKTSAQLTAAENALAAATTRVNAAEAAANVTKGKAVAATELLNQSTRRAVVSTTALGAATKFLMGPWGLLLTALGTAATAFYLTKESSDEVNKSLEEQAASVASLNKVYSAMTKSALEEERNKLLERSNEILFERLDLEKQIEEQRAKAFTRGGLDSAAFEELNRLKDALQDLKEESAEIDKPLGVIIKTLKELYPVLGQNTTNTAALEKANKQAAQSYADMVKNLELERIQLTMNNDEFEIYMVMQQASANQWTPEMTAQIIEQTRAIQDQRKALETVDYQLNELMGNGDLFSFGVDEKETLKMENNLNSLIDKVDGFGGAWSRTGNIIADSLGDAVSQLEDYSSKMQSISKLQSELTAKRKEYADGSKEAISIDEALAKLQDESYSTNISALGKTIGLSAQLFAENSKERKAMHALEMGFLAAEIALSTKKAIVNAVEAVTNQGDGDPYTAFARIAAMIGIMGGVLGAAGIAFSGGGGGGGGNGTGASSTVMGGGTSESLSNASESLEDIMIDQLAELRGLRGDLNTVNDRTFGLFRDLLAVDAGHSEIKNRTEMELERSFAGLNMGVAGGAFTSQLSAIFDSIGDSISEAMGVLSLTTDKSVSDFVFRVSGISFDELSGEEAEKRLSEILSAQSDLLVEMMVPFVKEYQQTGEGALETLTRLAKEQAVFNDALERTGMNLNELSSVMQIDVAQSIIKLIGGAEEFSDLADEFFENFYSDAEQFQYLQKSITDVFDQLGLGISGSREEFRALIEGIDLTTAAGQELYAALLQVSPAMAEYFDTLDELANDKLNLQIQLLEKQGKSEEALALSRELELASMDESLHAIMMQIWALDDAARAERERAEAIAEAEALANQQKNLQVRLLEAQGKSEAALALQRELELASLDESLHALQKQIWAQEDLNKAQEALNAAREEERRLLQDNIAFAENELEKARRAEIDRINATVTAAQNAYDKQLEAINAQRDAYNQLISEIEGRASNAENALNDALSAELSKYDDMIAAANDSAQEQINAINSVSSARLSALNDELSIVASVAGSLGAASKQFTATQALAAARSGNFNPAANIVSGGSFGSATEARIAAAREAFALNEIGKLADAQMSDLERTIAATEQGAQSQIDAINAANDEQVAELEAQKKAIEEQVKAVLGVDDSVLALDVAIAQYQKAQDELQAAIAENTLDKLQAQEDLALEALNQAKESAQSQIDALNTQIDELLNIDNSVSSVEDAIKLLLAERKELADFEADVQSQQLEAQIAIIESVNSVRNAILDQAQNSFTKDLVTIVNDPTSPIITPPIYIIPESVKSNDVVNELKLLRKDLDNANSQIGANTKKSADSLRKLEYLQQ